MSKFKSCLSSGLILISFSSCVVKGPQIFTYGPPMYADDIAYQPKPISSDSVHHAAYVSASYSQGGPPNSKNSGDDITMGQLNIGQGFTFNNFNLSYGAFGGIGSYHNQTNNNVGQPNYFTSKSFENLGGRFSINAFITSGNVDIRFIGFEMAYSHEYGDYAGYRESVTGQPNYFTDTQTQLVTMGASSEVIWHSSRAPLQFGLRLFIGLPLGDGNYKNPNSLGQLYYPQNIPLSIAYFMQVKNVFFVGEVNPDGGILRVGLRF
jgi:hypothetical protein